MLVKTSCLAVALTACLCISQGAVAEEKKAVCEFHNHGDLKKDKTGPCGYTSTDEEIENQIGKWRGVSPHP
jgi:hypothetical protein